MKKHLLASTVFLALMLAGNFALADNTDSITQLGDGNQAAIMQEGDHNDASIGQVGFSFGESLNPVLGKNKAQISQSKTDNMPLNSILPMIDQIGFENAAEVDQSFAGSVGNQARISQFGIENKGKIDQKTFDNKAEIIQGDAYLDGPFPSTGNEAYIEQDSVYGDDEATILQFGQAFYNKASIQQGSYGGSNRALISQTAGSNNEAKITQEGYKNNHSGLPATIVQINGDYNRAHIRQTGDESKLALINQTGDLNRAVLKQLRDPYVPGVTKARHSATISQGNPAFSNLTAANNAVVVQQGAFSMHKATVNQGSGTGPFASSVLNTALVAQTDSVVNDTSVVNQGGGEHLAISIQGIQPGHSDAWKDSQPMTPVPPAFGFQMFTN